MGLILTGGRSTRMGEDKSKLVYHQMPQREHLTQFLRPFCKAVYWSVNPDQAERLQASDQPFIVDAYTLSSPLNGILSAFRFNAQTAWLVVACDMPLLTDRSLACLVQERDPKRMATVFYDSDGQLPEPLLGIYEPAIAPRLLEGFTNGEISPRSLLQRLPIKLLTVPDLRELTNINDPVARAQLGL